MPNSIKHFRSILIICNIIPKILNVRVYDLLTVKIINENLTF